MGYEQFYRLQAEKKRYDQQQYQLKLQEEERLKMIQEAKTSGATELSDVEAGFRSGVSGIKQLGYGAVGLVGQALGEEGLQKWGVENYKKAEKEAEKYTVGRTTSLEDIKSFGDVVDWTEYNLGNLTPSMIESLGSAAIGAAVGTAAEPGVGTAAGAVAGFVAKDTTKKFLEKQVTKYIAKGLLKEEAEKMAEKALVRKIGSGTVMFANSYVQGMGDVYGETLDENGKGNVMASFLGAIPYAAVDTIADISILGRVVKGSAGENALKRYSKAFAKSGITGGAEETIQEAELILSGLLSGKSYSSEEVISRLGNSFAAAAVGGGALGILGGRKSSEKKAKYSLEDTLKIPYNQAQRTYEPTGSQIEGVKTPQEEKISVQSEGEKIISRTPQDSFSEYLQSLSPVENEVLGKMLQKEVPDDAVSNLNRDEIKAIRKALRIAKNIPGANTDVIQGNLDKITTIGEETGILQKRDISSIDTKQEFFEEKLQQKAEKDLQPAEVKIQQEKKYGDEIIEEKNIYTEHAANIYDDLIRFIDKKDKSLPTYIGTEKSITAESLQQVADSMVKNTVPSEKTARMVYARVKNELTKRISGISKKENISKVKNKTVIKKEKEVKKSEPKNKIPKEYFKTEAGSAVREELSQAMPGERIYIPSNEPGKNFDVVRNPSSFPKYIGSEKSHRTTKVLQRVLDAIENDTIPSDMMAQRVYNRVHNEILSRMGKKQKSFPAETRKNAKKVAEKTQIEKVKEVIGKEKKSIKQIAEETKIKEPNIRRILGVGAKEGVFSRVEKGVYVLSKNGEDLAYVETGDAVESLGRLAKEGFKADMVFLDIPYDTPAVKGGNRGVKYNLLSVEGFSKILDSVSKIVRTANSPIIHMYSQAASGMKAMQKYNDLFLEKGYIPVGKGEYQKTFANGQPVTSPNGKVSRPEGILVFTKSGKLNKELKNLNFKLVRPKGYQTEKSAQMLREMIEMTTEEGDVVVDPFAGSGVTIAEAVKAKRKGYAIEKNKEVAEKITRPRVEQALAEVEEVKNKKKLKKISGKSLEEMARDYDTSEEFVREVFSDIKNPFVKKGAQEFIDTLNKKYGTKLTIEDGLNASKAFKKYPNLKKEYESGKTQEILTKISKKYEKKLIEIWERENQVKKELPQVEEPTSYYIGKDFDIDGYAKRRDQYEKEITALEKVADMKMREGSKSISKQKLSIVERAKQMTLLRSEIYSKLDKDIDSVQKRYFGTSNLFYFDNDKKKPIVLPKDKVSAQKAKQALEAASKSPMMHDFAVLQEVAKTFDTEVNPVLKASLHVDILRKILTKEGKASGALGTYNPNNYGISISTEDGPEKAVEVIRHEVLHHAYNLLPIEDKKVVLKWYKSLSREQLDQIYGVDKEGSLYDRYHERYKGREASLADETFSHFFSNNVGFIKDTTTENYLLRAYKNAIRKVMWYLRRIRNYVAGERVVRDIYQSVFSQVGGRRFIIDMEKMDRLASQGVEMGKVKFSDFTKLQDGTMLFEKKNGVLTEKGRLDYRKALQSGWKKLYGENPPRKIVNMFERNDIELFRASARISFTGGMERQADLNKNMEEFQKAASIFVEENLPENLRGKFIDRILNAKDDKSFQRVMEDVDKENAAEDARDLKRFEKRLSDENKLKVKMDNLKESHRASILKKNEQILKIREDNISKIKEVRSRLTKMFKERIATGEQVRATAAEYVIASLPKRERSAFLKAIAKAKTEKGLRKIMERVDSKRSAYERRFLVNNIQELTKNIGKLPVDIQRSIIDITANLELKNHTQKFLDKLQKTKEYLDRQGTDMDMPRRVLNQLGILERTPLKNITTDQLAQINNTLKQYVNVGKNIMSNRQATMVYETNRAVGLLKNASRNLDVIDVSRKENILMEKEIGKAELAKEWLRRKRLGFLFIDRLFNKIDGTSDYSGLNHKMLKEPIDNAWNSWQIAMDRYLQTFWKTVNDYKLGEDSSRRIATWAYLQQKDGKRKLLEGGTYTEEQLRDFKLTEDEMTVYEMMREMLEEIHPRLKEYMANQHNVDLGYRENFFPMMTDYTVTKPLVDDLMAEATLKNIPFGSIKERKEGANQRLKMDAFAIFQSYVGKATYFMAMDPEITRIRKIVENEQYRKAVGELASREIMNWLNVLVRKGGPVAKEQPWQKAVTKLNNNLSFAILGWRIVTILKQPIAILNGAAELGSWAFKGIPMVINEEYRGFMDLHSSEMRNRSGGDIAYTELAENKKLAIIQEKSMKPTQFVDRYTAGAVWMGAYHKKLSELGEKFDIDKPNNDAIRYADLIVRLTQSTGTFKDIGSALTGEDRFANKLLFKFQSFVLNNWNYISEDIPNNFSKDKTVAARQIAFLSLAMLTEAAVGTASKQIFQQAVRGGEDDDNDESLLISSLKSIITSTITAVPYIGQIANTIMYGSTNPVPLISFIEKSLTSVRQVKNAKKMDTRQRHMIRIAAYTIGVIYGIPTDQARIMLEKALFGDKNKSKL